MKAPDIFMILDMQIRQPSRNCWSIFIIIIVFNADGLAKLRDQRRGG